MLTWILTSIVIAALSAAAFELFREVPSPTSRAGVNRLRDSVSPKARFGTTWTPDWDTLSDAELDALVQEYAQFADEPLVPSSQGSF